MDDLTDHFTTAVPPTSGSSRTSLLSDKQDAEKNKVSWRSLFTFTDRRNAVVLTAALALSTISGLVLPGMAILMGKIFSAFAGFGSGAHQFVLAGPDQTI